MSLLALTKIGLISNYKFERKTSTGSTVRIKDNELNFFSFFIFILFSIYFIDRLRVRVNVTVTKFYKL